MKKIKLYYMGKRLKDIYPHATRFQTFRFNLNWYGERTLLALFIAGIGVGVGYAVSEGKKVNAYEVKIVEREVVKEELEIMNRIADCESGKRVNGRAIKGTATHYEKDGKTVLFRLNTNNTWDIGYQQINSVHLPEATRLGLDITKETDNKKFAMHLLNTQGTEPWYSSKSCWSN